MKSFAKFFSRFATALVLGSITPGAVAFAAEPAPAQAAAQSKLTLVESAIAPSVDARKPVDAATRFDNSVGSLFAFVKVKNLGEPTTLTMVWKHEGKKKLAIDLAVGRSVGWATWSKKGIVAKSVGHWTVEVIDAEGILVDTLAFDVTGATSVGAK